MRQADSERRVAIDRIPGLVWGTLPDGSSDFNNQRWLEYTGLSEEEARDWGYKSVIHPEDYQRLVAQWARHFASGEPIEDEARLRRSDGEYRWFLHRAVPLRDEKGAIVKWYGTSTDIEDLKRAESVLRDHARLLDLTHDTVFVRDMSDAITYWNRGAEALYGWSRDEAVGKISHQLTQTIFLHRSAISMMSCSVPAAGRVSWCTPSVTGPGSWWPVVGPYTGTNLDDPQRFWRPTTM